MLPCKLVLSKSAWFNMLVPVLLFSYHCLSKAYAVIRLKFHYPCLVIIGIIVCPHMLSLADWHVLRYVALHTMIIFVVVRLRPWLHQRVDKKDTRYFLRLGRPFAAQYAFAVMKTYFRHEYLLPSWSSGLHESQWRKVEKKVTFIGLMVPTGVHAFAIGQCIYSVLQS